MNNNILRGFRQAKRMTLDEAARRSGLDPGLLSKVERGIIKPSARVRAALSKLYPDFPEQVLFPPNRGK